MSAILDKPVIGSKELRNNLSDFLDQVISKKRTFFVGKVYRPAETAALIPTEMLEYLIAGAQFDSSVSYDENSGQYVASIQDFNADGVGETPAEAVEMALDNIDALVEDFFANTERYLGFERFRKQLPQYLKLKMTPERRRKAEILGFRLEG